jgi:hypothetical protein
MPRYSGRPRVDTACPFVVRGVCGFLCLSVRRLSLRLRPALCARKGSALCGWCARSRCRAALLVAMVREIATVAKVMRVQQQDVATMAWRDCLEARLRRLAHTFAP